MSQKPAEGEDTPAVGTEDISSDRSDDLSKDTMFELLKNQRRRDALHYLAESGGESTLSDLAEQIAAKENGIERRALSSDQRKRVYIGLYQCHLPKLAEAGVVDFEKHRGDVELRDPVTQLEPYLDERPGETSGESEEAAVADSADTRAAERTDEDAGDGGDGEADRVAVSVADDEQRHSSSGTLPASFEEPDRGRPSTADLVTAGVGAAAAAGILGFPGLRRVPKAAWVVAGLAVAVALTVRNSTQQLA